MLFFAFQEQNNIIFNYIVFLFSERFYIGFPSYDVLEIGIPKFSKSTCLVGYDLSMPIQNLF